MIRHATHPRVDIRRAALLLSAAWLLLILLGCSQKPQRIDMSSGAPRELGEGPEPLVAKADVRVADIPIPVGFKVQESKSFAQANSQSRYVSHYYKGRSPKERVAGFYLDQMTTNHRWSKESYRQYGGEIKMDFGKGNERCVITITEDMWGYSTAHVEIYLVERSRS
jgi:hypothetical protein